MNVADQFPDVPERCLRCPALEAAVVQLEVFYEINAEVAMSDKNPANPTISGEDYVASLQDDESRSKAELSMIFTAATVDLVTGILRVAKELYTKCEDGALYKPETLHGQGSLVKARKVTALTRQCRSLSPVASFVPVLYSESDN